MQMFMLRFDQSCRYFCNADVQLQIAVDYRFCMIADELPINIDINPK